MAVAQSSADPLEEIVVTGRRGAVVAIPGAIDHFKRYCYDPIRTTGAPALPTEDADWVPLAPEMRSRFGIRDAATPAYTFLDGRDGSIRLLKAERVAGRNAPVETQCTMAVVGARDAFRYPRQLSALFGGTGTQRHVGQPDGVPKIKGWAQFRWSAMPIRHSSSWREMNSLTNTASRNTWLVVSDPSFYREYDYVVGDLKIRRDTGRPISVITLTYVSSAGSRAGSHRRTP